MNTQCGTADTPSAFSKLPWHDAELLAWSVGYGTAGEVNVTFDINFSRSDIVTGRAEVNVHDCRGFYTNVDFLAKKLCGDQIATAYSEGAEESDVAFGEQLNDRFDLYPGASMQGLFVFSIKLIHPGGEFVVIARSFSLRSAP
jgi:hypothetical protein